MERIQDVLRARSRAPQSLQCSATDALPRKPLSYAARWSEIAWLPQLMTHRQGKRMIEVEVAFIPTRRHHSTIRRGQCE